MTETPPPPPRVGTDAERSALAALFARAGFSESTVLARLSLSTLDELEGDARAAAAERLAGEDLTAVLLRILVLGQRVSTATLDAAVGNECAAALKRVGLVGPETAEDVVCPVQLVPVDALERTLLIACDRRDDPDGEKIAVFSDFVYSGHNMGTLQFLRFMPHTEAASVLDLCSGTAVIGLAAAARAPRAVAIDITARSTAFAKFNCWLNGDTHVEVLQGDLFGPVLGERFDRILAHPPYVPTRGALAIYRDGGETGDELLRRIIAEVPGHLQVGGTFHIITIGMDTTETPFEARVREWLGEAGPEFDLVFGMTSSMTAAQFAHKLATRVATAEPGDYERWMDLFGRLSVRDFVYGGLVGRRLPPGTGNPQSRRVLAEPDADAASFSRLFDWFDWMREPDHAGRLMRSTLSIHPETRVEVNHVVRDGHFSPDRHRLRNGGRPFSVEIETDGWVIHLMNEFDGRRTAEEIYDEARRSETIPNRFTREDFSDLVGLLAERGLLHFESGGPVSRV